MKINKFLVSVSILWLMLLVFIRINLCAEISNVFTTIEADISTFETNSLFIAGRHTDGQICLDGFKVWYSGQGSPKLFSESCKSIDEMNISSSLYPRIYSLVDIINSFNDWIFIFKKELCAESFKFQAFFNFNFFSILKSFRQLNHF